MERFDYGVCNFSLMFCIQILALCVYDLNFVNFVYLCEIATSTAFRYLYGVRRQDSVKISVPRWV